MIFEIGKYYTSDSSFFNKPKKCIGVNSCTAFNNDGQLAIFEGVTDDNGNNIKFWNTPDFKEVIIKESAHERRAE